MAAGAVETTAAAAAATATPEAVPVSDVLCMRYAVGSLVDTPYGTGTVLWHSLRAGDDAARGGTTPEGGAAATAAGMEQKGMAQRAAGGVEGVGISSLHAAYAVQLPMGVAYLRAGTNYWKLQAKRLSCALCLHPCGGVT